MSIHFHNCNSDIVSCKGQDRRHTELVERKTNSTENKFHKFYNVVSKIFDTDAVEIVKLTIRPIGRLHPRSSSLLHVDTGPTVSSMFGTLPGSPFLSECQTPSAIRPVSPQWYQTGVLSPSISFLEIGRSDRVQIQVSTVCGE